MCIRVCMCVYVFLYIYTMYVCMYVYMYVYMYLCMYVFIYVFMYVYARVVLCYFILKLYLQIKINYVLSGSIDLIRNATLYSDYKTIFYQSIVGKVSRI